MSEVADHLATQPELVRSKILYVQAMYGSTGDSKPWPGTPADPIYSNLTSKSEEFFQYIREVNTRLCVEYQDTGIIPLYVVLKVRASSRGLYPWRSVCESIVYS